jgi:hypothetical protein
VIAFDSCSNDSKFGMPPNPIPIKTFDNGKKLPCKITTQKLATYYILL